MFSRKRHAITHVSMKAAQNYTSKQKGHFKSSIQEISDNFLGEQRHLPLKTQNFQSFFTMGIPFFF